MTGKEIVVFLLTMLAFCVTYTSLFISMKNMVELTREKQRKTHAEFLLAQVQSQAKEAEIVRQNRHDMRHHYQMLLSYAERGDLSKLTAYLQRQTERIEAITTGRFCENETVNNILKVYHQKAAEQDIAMEIRAAAKPGLSATDPDLVAIIANVLENALHGAAKSGSESPFIRVNIKHQAQRFVISCDNSCSKSLVFEKCPNISAASASTPSQPRRTNTAAHASSPQRTACSTAWSSWTNKTVSTFRLLCLTAGEPVCFSVNSPQKTYCLPQISFLLKNRYTLG